MKSIGVIDYYLNEWHALNYPEMLKRVQQNSNEEEARIAFAYAETDLNGYTTDDYCKQFGVTKCSSIKEVCEKSDYLMVLYPDRPERKIDACLEVLKYGKPVFIDKTFVKDFAQAKKVFEVAEKYHTPMFSSSSLRYADEIKELPEVNSLLILAPALHLKDYWVHPLEMLVAKMGVGAKKVMLTKSGNHYSLHVEYDNKSALVIIHDDGPHDQYYIGGSGRMGQTLKMIQSPFFDNEMKDILRFYKEKVASFPKEETLELMKIRDAALLEKFDEWISL